MIDHAYLMRTAMRDKDMLVIASDTPDTGSATIRLVSYNIKNATLIAPLYHL